MNMLKYMHQLVILIEEINKTMMFYLLERNIKYECRINYWNCCSNCSCYNSD